MTVQAHVDAIDCDLLNQIRVLVQQFGGDKERWSAAVFGGNFVNELKGLSRFLPGETKSPVDHVSSGEEAGNTFGGNEVAEVIHSGHNLGDRSQKPGVRRKKISN